MILECDRRTVLLGLGAAALPLPVAAAKPRSDPQWVHLLLTALHPGLYRYQTPRQFERRFAAFARAWVERPALEARYLALARLMGSIRCGHSYVNPYNQRDSVIARLTGGRGLLPFRFRWIAGEMVVSEEAAGLAPGTRIIAVDGVPSRQILASLIPFARADGGNDAKRRALMELSGHDEFEAFDLFHPLLFPTGRQVTLRLVGPDGRRDIRRLKAVDRAARLASRRPSPARGSDQPIWTMTRTCRTAVLTMDSWSVYNSKWDWKGWLGGELDRIATDGTRGLIIDLRANEGGRDCGDPIIARLATAAVAAEPYRRLVRFAEVPADLRPPLDTWDKSFFALGREGSRFDERYRQLPGNDGGVVAPAGPRFVGRVAVLTSATNSSATFSFARRIQRNRLATLVGEPTGGNRRGINGGAYFFVRLPESDLEFDLPLIGYFPATPQPDAGIKPAIAVPLTAAALAAGRDEAMERALAIVA